MWEAFCFRCRNHVLFEPRKTVDRYGYRARLVGNCPVCGAKVGRFVALHPSRDSAYTVRVDTDVAEVIDRFARAKGIPRKEVVREAMALYAEREGY